MDRNFDQRGYLVRQIYGRQPQVFAMPGEIERRYWLFDSGLSVTGPSLTDALQTVEWLLRARRTANGLLKLQGCAA